MNANAGCIRKNFLDRGRLELQTGKGYYDYPDPAYRRPDISLAPDLVS
ncbi:hypothetical protein [Streptomyces sp. NPDC000618]